MSAAMNVMVAVLAGGSIGFIIQHKLVEGFKVPNSGLCFLQSYVEYVYDRPKRMSVFNYSWISKNVNKRKMLRFDVVTLP
jgi:hypothetical protein